MPVCRAELTGVRTSPPRSRGALSLAGTMLLLAGIMSLAAGTSWAVQPLTLDEALTATLKNHPLVMEAKGNLQGAEARTGQALAAYYPQINFTADWANGRSFIIAQESIRSTELNSEALNLRQTIYDFGRSSGAVAAARGNREAADQTLTVTRQELTLRVRSAYYLVLAAEKQVVAVRENVSARENVYRQTREFFSQGIRAKVDLARAVATLYAAKTALIRAESNREIARVELANAMGVSSLGERTLAEPSLLPLILPERSSSLDAALHNRAELQQMAAVKAAASGTLRTARSSYLPVITGIATVGYAERSFPPTGNVWGVGLNLTVPLFSGFMSMELVREATATLSSIEARQENLKLQIIREVESAWLSGNEAAARMISTEKEVVASDESRALAEGRYQEGVGSIIEVTDAQAQALDASTARIQALFDYYTARARLDRAVGN